MESVARVHDFNVREVRKAHDLDQVSLEPITIVEGHQPEKAVGKYS